MDKSRTIKAVRPERAKKKAQRPADVVRRIPHAVITWEFFGTLPVATSVRIVW